MRCISFNSKSKVLLSRYGTLSAFNYDYVDQGAFPYGQYNTETGKVEPVRINDPSTYWRRMLNNSIYYEWKTDKFLLSSTTAYQYLKDDMKMDQDYTEKSIFTLNQKQKQYAWSEEVAIRSNHQKNYQWSFGAYGFYNSLKTDGPVMFKEDGLKDVLQKAFDEIVAGNPKAPQLTVYGDDKNQIYFLTDTLGSTCKKSCDVLPSNLVSTGRTPTGRPPIDTPIFILSTEES